MWCIIVINDKSEMGGVIGPFFEKENAYKHIRILKINEMDPRWEYKVLELKEWGGTLTDNQRSEDVESLITEGETSLRKAEDVFFKNKA